MSGVRPIRVLDDLFGSARDQGARPTCLAFAASDLHAALRPGWEPLSCEYLFFHAQRRAGQPADRGARLPDMLDALRIDGQPREQGWPCLRALPANMNKWRPPPGVGEIFRRAGRAVTGGVERITSMLDRGAPLLVTLRLSRSFHCAGCDASGPPGVVDPPDDEKPDPAVHAVVAIGHGLYDGRRAILVRNSWGAGWGNGGQAWLTENFLAPRICELAALQADTGTV